METHILSREQLVIVIQNGKYFDGFKCRWKKLSSDMFRVHTNYTLASELKASGENKALEKDA